MPKSVMRTRPCWSTSTLAGFRSRWSTPSAWAACEPGAQLPGDLDHPRRRQPAGVAEHRREVLPLDQLHREEHFVVGLADVEDPDDRGMRDPARQPHFLQQALAAGLAG